MTTTLDLDALVLDKGNHSDPDAGLCLLEAVAYFAGRSHTDAPPCVSPVLRKFGIRLNDSWEVGPRQLLKPFIPLMVGTAGDGQDEARGYLALDWLVRTCVPTWLDLAGLPDEAAQLRDLRRIVDQVGARSVRPMVIASRDAARVKRDANLAVFRKTRPAAYAAYAAAAYAAAAAAAYAAYAAAAAYDAYADAADAAAYAAADAYAAAAAAADAHERLRPTVELLRVSVLDLFAKMIDPSANAD